MGFAVLFALGLMLTVAAALTEEEISHFHNVDILKTDDVITFFLKNPIRFSHLKTFQNIPSPNAQNFNREETRGVNEITPFPSFWGISVEGEPLIGAQFAPINFLNKGLLNYGSMEDELLGVAIDGFPIYGLMTSGGSLLTSDMLDECHGRCANGTYRYHMTLNSPFKLECLKGVFADELKLDTASALRKGVEMYKASVKAGKCMTVKVQLSPHYVCKQPRVFRSKRQIGRNVEVEVLGKNGFGFSGIFGRNSGPEGGWRLGNVIRRIAQNFRRNDSQRTRRREVVRSRKINRVFKG